MMTAETTPMYPFGSDEPMHGDDPNAAATLNPHEYDGRDQLREDLYSYLKGVLDVDPHTSNPADEPKLAEGLHKFVTGPVHKKAAENNEARRRYDELLSMPMTDGTETVDPPKKILIVPFDAVRQRRERFYKRYGLDRRHRSHELREPQEEYLTKQKRGIYNRVKIITEKGETQRTPRYTLYPEIGIILQLRDLALDDGATTLMDASEVLLAAYGERFLSLANYSALQVIRDDQPHRTQPHRINPKDIPEEFRAEERGRR
jgi:hypothetical protein